MDLVVIWYALVVLCWVLFFVLEGFDFGVGLLSPMLGRDEHERAAAVRTIGPFWDGNEVWLVAAIGVTFAAFPGWYAALLSGLYLPMVAILLLLAGRGVALEFRGKHDDPRWRRRCDAALAACSAGVVLLWGAVLTVFVRGLALGAGGEVTGGGLGRTLAPVLTPAAALGALLALTAAVLLGATFLALRTTGPVRRRAALLARRVSLAAAAAALLAAGGAALAGATGTAAVASVAALFLAGLAVLTRRPGTRWEAAAFALTAAAVAGAVVAALTANGDVVLPSTVSGAFSLTMRDAAATGSALRLLSLAGVVVLPGVLVYQAWSYRVFRNRVASERVAS
ncbi:cytochrome d ubiquinol oxidase subunit II [Dactylosporangium aurantiacum]|uniref:Cytochrome d ubiquinol oxidase subunit II n=1 Tax=Dactylosporangium aurantiacum TaxID=35754 RepID=A0A9Q9MAG3_9ACTN|nr:cytochrome d ubiquinol oxidase subunit II [Dactylosporangium aurantiacum]MDG6107866.1 cytochrome d ubiquinol oxidase subunit II [Dactylosporangium aurantiacum]UWZ51818.1 cytochrome d ubiquinol oxidase subunit II [Dactylosporangium aurantiacum]